MNNLQTVKEIDEEIKRLQKRKETLLKSENQLHPDSKVDHYLQMYSGKRLLEMYTLESEGTWEIKGEDPNCDMAGPHHQPSLGFVKGNLKKVIEYAVHLNRFWVWGGGGDIVKVQDQLIKTL